MGLEALGLGPAIFILTSLPADTDACSSWRTNALIPENSGSIEFLGIHPQYHNQGIQKLFIEELLEKHLPGKEISMTTYRAGDKADTGYRDLLKSLGFAERELLIEYGYPTQRFVLKPLYKEKTE